MPILAGGSKIFQDSVWAEIARGLRLSSREVLIVRAIFDDRPAAAIANDLGISRQRVRAHLERLGRKLAAPDRATLILHVVEEFLLRAAAHGAGVPSVGGRRVAQLRRRD